ncbi:hypothetical protein WME98_46660 [Sorangium sp. So ce296]|uniref:hypothetical protein n=1 Tax=Sorangium sp. So ce296 TaxID=3133296 RepID=UPI003F640C75
MPDRDDAPQERGEAQNDLGDGIEGSVAFDSAGHLVVVAWRHDGYASGCPCDQAIVVKKHDAAGALLWSKIFEGEDTTVLGGGSASSVAIDASDSILFSGYVAEAIDLGGGPLPPGSAFVAKLTPRASLCGAGSPPAAIASPWIRAATSSRSPTGRHAPGPERAPPRPAGARRSGGRRGPGGVPGARAYG